jgi:hypothetical protein
MVSSSAVVEANCIVRLGASRYHPQAGSAGVEGSAFSAHRGCPSPDAPSAGRTLSQLVTARRRSDAHLP